ncbi:universal stress protein [Rhizobium sp. BK376]|uniref:universal stress protein n=1 Tax=Rhizobium sp. BK376 TaxID=2512149 RepID=UPI001050ED70|nr:universal stress protein [Rhizobium sp. BK376]TCR75635.1 universal stress protein family protein [Rhizobium sp. BK376]
MTIKTILCIVGMDHTNDDISSCVELCRQVDAHLTLLVIPLDATSPLGDYAITPASIWFEEHRRTSERLASKVTDLKEKLSNAGISFDVEGEWMDVEWAPSDIGERARYADLILASASVLADGTLKTAVLEAGLFDAMCPILMIPIPGKATLKPKTVLLAWDSSLEAGRSAKEALDIMAGADAVHVTMVDPDAARGRNGEEPGADIALYLTRHDIAVTVDRLPSGGREVGDVLAQHAIDISADLIVMGGYGHSRLRERVFGGLTRTFTTKPPSTIFIAR